MKNFEEKTLQEQCVYDGKFIKVNRDDVELANGQKTFREVVKHPGGVVVVAQKDENIILMVKQYRYPIKQVSLELPAGRLEVGEDPADAIKRELEEETGYVAKAWKSLGFIYTTPGICTEKLYLYHATDLEFKAQKPDDGEIIECFEYNLDEVLEMIKSGRINDSKTICAIFRAFSKNV